MGKPLFITKAVSWNVQASQFKNLNVCNRYFTLKKVVLYLYQNSSVNVLVTTPYNIPR